MLLERNDILLSHNDIVRKVNYQLTNSFFSLDDIKNLKLKQIKKIVKSISKIESIKLKRHEVKEIALYLFSGLTTTAGSATKIWSFIDFEKVLEKIVTFFEEIKSIFFIKNFRKDKYDLMRN